MARPNVRERARAAAGRERAKVTSSGADGSSVVASVAYWVLLGHLQLAAGVEDLALIGGQGTQQV